MAGLAGQVGMLFKQDHLIVGGSAAATAFAIRMIGGAGAGFGGFPLALGSAASVIPVFIAGWSGAFVAENIGLVRMAPANGQA